MPPLQLKIQNLDDTTKIIHKKLVPDGISLYRFHQFFQAAMSWGDYHLFEFSDSRKKGTIRVGIPSPNEEEYVEPGCPPLRNSEEVLLKDIFLQENLGIPFYCTCDFEDNWEHRITFQKVPQKELKVYVGFPTCIEAQGKCPLEYSSGTYGFIEFLNIITDQKHPEFQKTIEWLGIAPSEEYDEKKVNLEEIKYQMLNVHFKDQFKS